MNKLIIVIINWNTRDLTQQCLQSLYEELKSISSEVWVVDNASTDNSVRMIKEEFPQVRLLENKENVGFARANNQVLKYADGEYYLLLNSDTIIPEGAIQELCQFMDEHPEAGAAGPRLKNALGIPEKAPKSMPTLAGEFRYCLAYHFFPFNSLFRSLFGRRRQYRIPRLVPVEAEVLSAACLIIRQEVVKRVGVLAEDYFLFSEENDYFYRMHQAGFKGYYLPHINVIHLVGMSRKKRSRLDSEVNFFKSRMLFLRKFHRRKMPIFYSIYGLFFIWSYLVMVIWALLKFRNDYEEPIIYARLMRTLWGRD